MGGVQPAYGVQDVEPGARRSFGVVLVRSGPAEVGQDAVAHQFCNVAIEARDSVHSRVQVDAQNLAHLLGVEPGGQRGRADQVDEHDRELPAFGLRPRRGGRRRLA